MRWLLLLVLVGCSTRTDPEVARVRAHLLAAELELRAADVSHLSPAQRAARERNLDRLARYREAGVFPHNHHRSVRTPVFIDDHGTRCAMAHLIELGGGAELTAAVAATRNHATVHQLADQPALLAWLDRNGLSIDDAARIQPAYDPCQDARDCDDDVPPAFAFVSLTLAAVDGAAIAMSLDDDAGTYTGAFGVAAGLVTMIVGGGQIAFRDDERLLERDIGWFDLAIGTLATAAGIRRLVLADRPEPPRVTLAPAVDDRSIGVVAAGSF